MDAEETVYWIERRSAAVAEWSSRTMGKKDCWDTDRKGEMSELNPRGPNVHTTATGPSSVQAKRILDLKNDDNPNPSHNTRYTKTKERPAGIQQSTNAEMRMTRARYSEELLSTQRCGGNDQHSEGKDQQPHDKPDEGATLVNDTGGRPVRKKTPSI